MSTGKFDAAPDVVDALPKELRDIQGTVNQIYVIADDKWVYLTIFLVTFISFFSATLALRKYLNSLESFHYFKKD